MTTEPPLEAAPGATRNQKIALGCGGLGIVVLIIAMLVLRTGQALVERYGPTEEIEERATVVEVVELTPAPFEFTVPVAGTLAPIHSVDIFPKLGGRVVKMHVGLGDEVRAGDPLATVESPEYRLMHEQATIGYEMADDASDMAQRSLERLEQVHAQLGEGALSEQDLDMATIQADGAQTQAEVARLQRSLAGQMISNATMTAPVDGVVAKANARLGGMVGQQYPAFHIADTTSLVVRCEVGDVDLPLVKVGQEVRLQVDALPDLELRGTVSAVSTMLDAWTRRAPVEIDLPNPDGLIAGNLFGRGAIIVDFDPAALAVPLEVVRQGEAGSTVQVVRDGRVVEVPVTVRGQSGALMALGDIEAGEQVIVPGPSHLPNGALVVVGVMPVRSDHVAE